MRSTIPSSKPQATRPDIGDWDGLCIWTDPLDRDRVVTQLLREGTVRNHEYRFQKKNGEIGVGLLSAELIEIDGKQCAITTTADITERLHLESKLRQAQKLEASAGWLAVWPMTSITY